MTIHGEFALRGEVLDIFMPGMDEAVRIVFGFDEIEDIKYFDPQGQHSTGHTEEITIYPNREIIWTDRLIEAAFMKNLVTEEEREQLFEFRTIKGEEYIYPHAFDCRQVVTDYAGDNHTLFLVDSELLEQSAGVIEKELKELYAGSKKLLRYQSVRRNSSFLQHDCGKP